MTYLKKNILSLRALKTITVVLLLALTSMYTHAQRSVRIGYIDTEYILENITEYQTAQSQLEAKVQQWKT